MTALIATVGGYVCCLTLLASGLVHARGVREFASVLHRQRIVPDGLVGTAARAIVALELTLGAAGIAALAVARAGAAPVLMAAAVLYAAYAAYSAHLVRHGRDVPCGCSADDLPVSGAVVARAAGLSLAALAAAVLADRALAPAGSDEFAVVALASIGLTLILWTLPAALHDPSSGTAHLHVSTHKPLEGTR